MSSNFARSLSRTCNAVSFLRNRFNRLNGSPLFVRSLAPAFASPSNIWQRSDLRRMTTEATAAKDETPKETITVTFIKGEDKKVVKAPLGSSILEVAHKNDVDLEGACEGSLACSTCHVIMEKNFYDMLPEPTDEENDMLDLAFGLTDTSRLGCQIIVKKELDGMVLKLPAATRNMAVDGYKPPKH
eukprot:TRINITY_DN2845_c1_g1_i1.p1 TRINITY_DN2845_c1_g1~~TRINITY_DN2845_c1_g1_i1.p1  ORF type:complete len:204 (-),score=40.56 TRINITY_DN2845_c1_g1_i1:66-623(-)